MRRIERGCEGAGNSSERIGNCIPTCSVVRRQWQTGGLLDVGRSNGVARPVAMLTGPRTARERPDPLSRPLISQQSPKRALRHAPRSCSILPLIPPSAYACQEFWNQHERTRTHICEMPETNGSLLKCEKCRKPPPSKQLRKTTTALTAKKYILVDFVRLLEDRETLLQIVIRLSDSRYNITELVEK